jgi:radical SAM superfamily enzyme YgiQ (UPF0313 family)
MPKILLINPQSINKDALPIPPLGVLYLVAYCRKNGFDDIRAIDNNLLKMSLVELEEHIVKCDIVGVSGTTSQYKEAAEISYLAKMNGKISIMGGPHATAIPERVLKTSAFDFVVVGEGEMTFVDLLHHISNPDKVKGIVFRRDGQMIRTLDREFANVDMLPLPARDLISMFSYGNKELKRFSGEYTHMMGSRGCGSHCTFCSSPKMWKICRFRSADKIFEEMMFLHTRYGIRNIHFQDDNFTIFPARIFDLCARIQNSGIGFQWSCQTRPDRVTKKMLLEMKKAGCSQVEFGVESGDENILNRARKKYNTKQIKKAVDAANEVGINTYGFFIVGLPGETIFTWLKSIRFAKKLKLKNCVWTVLAPFPGTEIYDKGLVKILDKDYTNWLYKRPVIKSGWLGPRVLRFMRWIADRYINGLFNTGAYK